MITVSQIIHPILNKSIYLNLIILLANYGSLEYCILDCKYYMCCLQRNILDIWNIRTPMVGHILEVGRKRFTTKMNFWSQQYQFDYHNYVNVAFICFLCSFESMNEILFASCNGNLTMPLWDKIIWTSL